jgi:hypothetical protein
MIQIRRHITFISLLWLLSVILLDVIIPLHFFTNKHESSCELNGKDCCTDKESSHCEICAFDLFIGYPQEFSFTVQRKDVLLAIIENKVFATNISITQLYTQLRAPPTTY